MSVSSGSTEDAIVGPQLIGLPPKQSSRELVSRLLFWQSLLCGFVFRDDTGMPAARLTAGPQESRFRGPSRSKTSLHNSTPTDQEQLMTFEPSVGISRRLDHFVSFCSVLSTTLALGAGRIVSYPGGQGPRAGTGRDNHEFCHLFCIHRVQLVDRTKGTAHRFFWRMASKVAAATACLVSLLSLLEHVLGWGIGMDQLPSSVSPTNVPGSLHPALMSPIAASGFLCLGLATLTLDANNKFVRWLGRLLPCMAAIASLFALLDFALNPAAAHAHIS